MFFRKSEICKNKSEKKGGNFMLEKAKWIWVSDHTEEDFYIVHLKKEILFDKKINEFKIECTGDTFLIFF